MTNEQGKYIRYAENIEVKRVNENFENPIFKGQSTKYKI
jgi:hypothetical protein